jgi:MoxR-like ATPase
VYVEDSLNRYVVAILRHTRGDSRLALGASPRAGIALLRVAKALAALHGREYVIPADIKDVAADVLSHRVIMAADARTGGVDPSEVISEAVDRTPVPV